MGGWLYLRAAEARAAVNAFRAAAAPAAPPASADAVERWRRIDRTALHPVNAEELDRVIAKLDSAGAHSLSADERAFLERLAS